MAYFQIQHKKHGLQWKYDFWKVEGNERVHLKIKFMPRELTNEETTFLQSELKRIYADMKISPYNPVTEIPVDTH